VQYLSLLLMAVQRASQECIFRWANLMNVQARREGAPLE
jgi:hypothetical protein